MLKSEIIWLYIRERKAIKEQANNPITTKRFNFISRYSIFLQHIKNCSNENIRESQRATFPKDAIILIGLYLELFIAIAHSDLESGCVKGYFVGIFQFNTKYSDQIIEVKV